MGRFLALGGAALRWPPALRAGRVGAIVYNLLSDMNSSKLQTTRMPIAQSRCDRSHHTCTASAQHANCHQLISAMPQSDHERPKVSFLSIRYGSENKHENTISPILNTLSIHPCPYTSISPKVEPRTFETSALLLSHPSFLARTFSVFPHPLLT